ncbi:MAG: type II toxin-antitoxin system prevent-host-death family antitoxin [Acidobacteria bacterium]|nr:type II toxin-antitoxin system prevent-host-death family antitoxin [Acidobacteriota bacterium]
MRISESRADRKPETATFDAREARRRFTEILDAAETKGGACIIRRAGHEVAAVVPVERFRQWEHQRQELFGLIDRVRRRTKRVPEKLLQAAIKDAVKEVRSRRRKRP